MSCTLRPARGADERPRLPSYARLPGRAFSSEGRPGQTATASNRERSTRDQAARAPIRPREIAGPTTRPRQRGESRKVVIPYERRWMPALAITASTFCRALSAFTMTTAPPIAGRRAIDRTRSPQTCSSGYGRSRSDHEPRAATVNLEPGRRSRPPRKTEKPGS
jgi:hypothetical protein